jgi:hypothetical protein
MFKRQYLAHCVGMNAIFLRSPTAGDYKRDFDKTTRAKIEGFCFARVGQIIEAINPLKIVAIGLDTLKLFGPTMADLKNEKGRTLTAVGKIAGRRAIATVHLSGARLSNADLDLIRDRVLAW